MIKLDPGNVLLKPSHRRRLMTLLRRTMRLGERIGDFVLTITMQRKGRCYDMRAHVHDAVGDFACHTRRHDWADALRELVRTVRARLHDQCVQRQIA